MWQEIQKQDTVEIARILVMTRDERTCSQLRDYYEMGEKTMMQQLFIDYVRGLDSKDVATRASGALETRKAREQRLLREKSNEIAKMNTQTKSSAYSFGQIVDLCRYIHLKY